MTTSVVILSYRPGDWLADAVSSVLHQADEVVVVDNGSPSAEASLIARRAGARVVRSERNLGFAGGVNLGVRSTTGDVIGLLNDDAVAGAGWLAAAEDVLSDPDVAAVGPKIRLAMPYREVLLPDRHDAPGDHRDLGRRLRSVTVEGVEAIEELQGGVYPFEGAGEERWRWSVAGRPWYVPLGLPVPAEPPRSPTGAGTGPGSAGGTARGPGPGPGPGAGTGSGPGPASGTGLAGGTGADTGTDAGPGASTGPGADTGPTDSGSAPGVPRALGAFADPAVLVDGQPAPPGATCRLINSAGLYLRPDGYAGDVGLGAPDDGRFDQRQDRFGLSGTALVFRAEIWRRIGPLATTFFAYYEDIDWCWRANLAGLRLVYDPRATVDHRRSATSGGAGAVRVMAETNRTLSMVRNGPLPQTVSALVRRFQEGSDGGVRETITARLPWAVATRLGGWARRSSEDLPPYQRARRLWAGGVRPAPGRPEPTSRSRAEVWRQWAGIDNTWDDSPLRPG